MLRDDLITQVLQQAGQRQDDTDLVLQAQGELMYIQFNLEHSPTLPWFLDSGEIPLAGTSGSRDVSYPTDFLSQIEEEPFFLFLDNKTYVELKKRTYGQLLKMYGASTGQPIAYSLGIQGFLLFPLPDKIYNYKFVYSKADTVLDHNVENLWTKYAQDVMSMSLLATLVTNYTQDSTLVRSVPNQLKAALNRLRVQTIYRREVATNSAMGDQSDVT